MASLKPLGGGVEHRSGINGTPVVTDDRGRPKITSSEHGFLVCIEENTLWCDHIHQVITQRTDSKSIFKDAASEKKIRFLRVAIIPSENIWAEVYLEPFGDKSMKAFLVPPESHGWAAFNPSYRFLGFLNEGEGRIQLRGLVVDWLSEFMDEGPVKCESMRHTYLRKAEVEDDLKHHIKLRIAHVWCYTWYKKCLHCLVEEGSSTAFDPDLIPKV